MSPPVHHHLYNKRLTSKEGLNIGAYHVVAEWEFSPIMLSPCFFFRDLSHEKKKLLFNSDPCNCLLQSSHDQGSIPETTGGPFFVAHLSKTLPKK